MINQHQKYTAILPSGYRFKRFSATYTFFCSTLKQHQSRVSVFGFKKNNDHSFKTLNGASQAKLLLYSTAGIQKILLVIFLVMNSYHAITQSLLQPIGQWREHLSYQNALQVFDGGDQVFCATPSAVFSVDNSNTITRFSKVTGLSDIGISAIGFDVESKQLVIAYTNSNIDVLKDGIVKNISDIKRSNVGGNKTINQVYCRNKIAYLSTGLGIVVIDLVRYEVKDTWQPGNNGNAVNVYGFCNDALFFYAATAQGIKRAAINSSNLADYRNWTLVSALNATPVRMVVNVGDKVVALQNDSLFNIDGSLLYADALWPIVSVDASMDKLVVSQRTATGNSRVLVLLPNGTIEKTIAQSGVISFPRSGIVKDNAVWVADFFGGLSKFTTTVERFIPNGPPAEASGDMVVNKGTLYVAAGAVNQAWNYQFNRNGIYTFANGDWSSMGAFNTPALDTVLDFVSLAVDPADNTLWAGSYGGGLVHFNTDNKPQIFKQQSTLQPAIGDPLSYRISGLAFDNDRNLWIANYGALQNLHVLQPGGKFKAITIPFTHFENAISQLIVDDTNQLWMVSPRGNGVFLYNRGNSVESTGDDQWKYYRKGVGNGNLPDNNVYCIAKDKDGFIWIGTARGIGIVTCAEQAFTAGPCEAELPIVQQDRFAGYLFQNEEVKTIAVDAANRKWIGTRNGLWLVSLTGNKTIYRFTEDNSPLLSNEINHIAIDDQSGEVFVSTFKGICSFRSTATQTDAATNEVLVFPNPVPPGYNGTIAIKGLPTNAVVKVAQLDGRLVFQARSLGGQFVWNGKNDKGEKVASGAYLVLVRDDKGTEKVVTKIFITQGR